MLNFTNLLTRIILIIFFFIFPFFFLNLTFEPTEQSKLLLLVITSLTLMLLYSLKAAFSRKITLVRSTYLLPLLLIVTIYIISSILNSPNIFLTMISSQSTSTWLFLFIFCLILSDQKNSQSLSPMMSATSVGTAVAALFTLGMYLGLIPKNVITPAGNLLSSAVFFLIIIIFQIATLAMNFSKKKLLLTLPVLLTIIAAEIVLMVHLLTYQKPILLPNNTGLQILTKVAKNPRSWLLGVGPANFISAFTLGKPASVNQTPIWNINFTSSSSLLLNMATEAGLVVGLIYIYILIACFYFLFKFPERFPHLFSLLILLVLLAFLPAGTALLILSIILLALTSQTSPVKELNLHRLGLFIYSIPLITLVFSSLVTYLSIRAFLAEIYYRQSFYPLELQEGTDVYNLQKQAISLNPYLDKYHLSISQTSLLLADSLANKENPSPEDLQNIPKLAQQAIDEARQAVKLNKTNVFNWSNLAKIYASLAAYAEGADIWAIEAAKQAALLDPNNPNSYLALSELYFNQDKLEEAEKYARRALILKNDLTKAQKLLDSILSVKGPP